MKQDPNLEFRPFPTSSWRVRIKQTLQKTKQQLCARQSKGAPPPWYAAKGSEAPLHQTISNKGSGDKTTFYVFSRTNGLFVQSKKRLLVQLHFWSCVAFCTRQVRDELAERKVLYTPFYNSERSHLLLCRNRTPKGLKFRCNSNCAIETLTQ